MEYEAREKTLWDYNSQMQSVERHGQKRGEEIAQERGEKRVNLLIRKLLETRCKEEVARAVSDSEYQRKLMDEFGI